MDKKTKILAGVFGVMVLYIIATKTVYPWLIEPLVTLGDRVVRRELELEKLEEKQEKVAWAVREYRRLMDRIGSGDVGKVENAIRQRLNTLFATHKLEEASTSPTKPHADRKTGVTKMTLTVTAVGSLESVVSFMRDVSELPQLIRIGNASIFPKSSSRRGKKANREHVNLRVPLEVWLLPQHKMLGRKVADADLDQPEKIVRHTQRDYSSIWKRTPFTEFVPYKPLIAFAGKNRSVVVGEKVTLAGSAKGGDGKYTFEWSGDPGLTGAETKRATVDTSKVGTFHYSLTVADDSDHVSTAQVTVDVKEKPKPALAEVPPEDKPVPQPVAPVKRRERWPNGKQMKIHVALVRSHAQDRSGEIQVYDSKRRERSYYTTGDELDGGTLVFVHPRAALVRWEDEFFVYPVGAKLSDDLQIADASDYPRFQTMAEQILASEKVPIETPREIVGPTVGDASDHADLVGPPAPKAKPAEGAPVQQGGAGIQVGGVPVVVPAKSLEAASVPARGGKPVVLPGQAGEAEQSKATTAKKKPQPTKKRPKKRRSKKFNKRRGRR